MSGRQPGPDLREHDCAGCGALTSNSVVCETCAAACARAADVCDLDCVCADCQTHAKVAQFVIRHTTGTPFPSQLPEVRAARRAA